MSQPVRVRIFAAVVIGAAVAALIASCSSTDGTSIKKPVVGQGGAQAGAGGDPGAGGAGNSAGTGGGIIIPEAGTDVVNETPVNQCGSGCGAEELCDPSHLGYDDNCNGVVDEGCPCTPGLSHWCFKGDPSSRNKGACKDGTEKCNEIGQWESCVGGFHADAVDDCLNQGTPVGCHDLTVPPFTTVNLKDGTGTFGQGATGVEFLVDCPPQIPAANCPKVQNGMSMDATYTPLQSGQYTVTFTKGGGAETCTFSLYVGSGGLRVELNWDHQGEGAQNHYSDDGGTGAGNGPDLDLHLHRPGFKSVWFSGPLGGKKDDCFYGNCTAANFAIAMMTGPNWFTADQYPHNWTYQTPYNPDDPIYTCYHAPRGAGDEWKMFKKGCHNPRLDLDNITCDKNVTDPQDSLFCAPENVNIDEPPYGLWTRIGVHYYGHCYSGDLHPTITIYCGGAQVAQLGPGGYNAPVTFPASGCGEDDGSDNTFWMVADVMAVQGMCGDVDCVVQPLYADGSAKTPLLSTGSDAKASFGPDCPAAPPDAGGPGCN